jgi:glutamine synthetase
LHKYFTSIWSQRPVSKQPESEQTQSMGFVPAWLTPEQVHTVVVAFPDAYGRLLGKRMTCRHFLKSIVKSGTHMCNYLLTVDIEMNPLDGFELASWEQGYGDFHGAIDLATLREIPWQPGTAIVLCDLAHDDDTPVAPAPRNILRRQLARLKKLGLYAEMGSELEFYLFENTYRDAHEGDYRTLRPTSDYLIDYHVLQPGRDENVMVRLRNEMDEAGITVEGSKGEWGRGQHELNLLHAEAMEMADRHVLFKNGAKEIAAQENQSISFMAKLDENQAGNSFHLHTSLWDPAADQNRFADPKTGKATELFRHFLGGLQTYARELCYFFAPTVNSYKRYQAESWAPTSLVWAHDNRTTGFRVVGQGPGFRIENRTPGADANPYLAYAATIAAGLRGVEEKIDCGEPYVGNAYTDETIQRLPASLGEAAELLAASELARASFGDAVVDFYTHAARLEEAAYRASVTDWERRRYFERI